jgi:hypothetical protein
VNQWFKVTYERTVFHFDDIGVKPTPNYPSYEFGGIAFVKITGWDTSTPGSEFLTADLYVKDKSSGNWTLITTGNIYYFAGSRLKFVGTAQQLDVNGVTANLLFVFTGKRDQADTKFILGGRTKLSTMGSSVLEVDDAPSTERWAGSAKMTGPMVPLNKVPPPIR